MEYISKYNSPNYDKGNKPKYIVIHHWGADGQNFNAVVNWLCNPKAGVSAHYVVGGNKCACIVAESNVAWHAGNYYYNSHSIGIECRPEMDKETYKTVIETVAMIYKHQKKVLPVIGHKDIVNTQCPGRYYSHLKDIQKQATALYKKGVKPTVSNNGSSSSNNGKLTVDGKFGTKSCKALQKWLDSKYSDGELSGQLTGQKKYILNMAYCCSFEGGGSSTVKLLQKKVGVTADGLLGANTIKALQKYLNKKGYKLTVDGYAGAKTVEALQKYLNKEVK